MPRALCSGGTYDYVLECDQEIEGDKPTFELKILSSRDSDELSGLTAAYQEATTATGKASALQDALAIVVKGWRNMGREYSLEALLALLTKRECWELVGDATLEAALSPDDRKKFESQSSSETDSSADVATEPVGTR